MMASKSHGAPPWQQLAAVLKKNLILQTRGRRSLFGLGGWAGLLLQASANLGCEQGCVMLVPLPAIPSAAAGAC